MGYQTLINYQTLSQFLKKLSMGSIEGEWFSKIRVDYLINN